MLQGNKLETLVNVAVLAVCILAGGILIWRFVIPHETAAGPISVPLGLHLRLQNVDWASTEKTAVVVVSTKCHFCSVSAPFFRTLVATAHSRNIRVVAVLPQDRGEAIKYLSGLDLQFDSVMSAPLQSVGVRATPTVLLVNRSGSVVDGWIGAARPERQTTLLGKL